MAARTTTRRSWSTASAVPASRPGLQYERRAWANGHEIVAGVDEAGRGAWAGPLVAAAAAIPRDGATRGKLTRALNVAGVIINDSKRLSHRERCTVEQVMAAAGIVVSIAVIPVSEIDRSGVGYANRLALSQAASGLVPQAQHLLVDGLDPMAPPCSWVAIIRGDACSLAIAMASIAAKVHRDSLMDQLDQECPGYAFSQHKGYGTAAHRTALERLGVSIHHRRTFAPIAALLGSSDVER